MISLLSSYSISTNPPIEGSKTDLIDTPTKKGRERIY